MHTLAIVIVNYRTANLTSEAIRACQKACKGIDTEIWVVDNHSEDNSVEYLRQRFTNINIIASEENLGYAKGNNLAIKETNSEYILLLNPDTIIPENSITECINFMISNTDSGAIGLKMHNIKGQYLRESKRGNPSLFSSLCKFTGLTSLFPNSKYFASYYLGHLSDDKVCKVNVLCGAFMFIRRNALKRAGLLDERFFMYGEDIDLSYRIKYAGYNCYFLPINMIHYKGESSFQNSVKYIENFYTAMSLFYDKYHTGSIYAISRVLVKTGVYIMKRIALIYLKIKGKRICKTSNTTITPYEIDPSNLPKANSHIKIDIKKYSYSSVIKFIIDNKNMNITTHIES